ncbi:hypothetical protein PENSPDRAFT_672682, partial [Peniophora sp. CONT]
MHLAYMPSTNVENGLPRKRGANRKRVKMVQCQDAPCRLRVKRADTRDSPGAMSVHDAVHLGISLRRWRKRSAVSLPNKAVDTCAISLLIDCGSMWKVERHQIAFYDAIPTGVVILPSPPSCSIDSTGHPLLPDFRCDVLCNSITSVCTKTSSSSSLHPSPTDAQELSVKTAMLRLLRQEVKSFMGDFILFGGGRGQRKLIITGAKAALYCQADVQIDPSSSYEVVEHYGDCSEGDVILPEEGLLLSHVPLSELTELMTIAQMLSFGFRHGIRP